MHFSFQDLKSNSIDEVRYIMLKSRCDGDVTVDSL